MKIPLAALVALVAATPALALPIPPRAVPVPAPELAIGAPAVLAVIAAYFIARWVIRRRAAPRTFRS